LSDAQPLSVGVGMFQVQSIDSFDLPQLQPYRTMRRQMEHRAQGIFVAEGEKVVRRLLESHFEVISVLLPEKLLRDLEPALQARPEKVQVYVAEKKLLETLTGFSMYQGLLAVGRVPAQISLEQLLAAAARPRLLAAVDGLSNAENIGALVRNCAAFQVQGLIVGETSSSPFLRRAVRSSMGTVFQLPIIEPPSLVEALRLLRANGVECVGAHPRNSGAAVSEIDWSRDSCVVFGSEGYGLSSAVRDTCGETAQIPMPETIDSLNVASAAAVFLYEANRQRAGKIQAPSTKIQSPLWS
jgi:tRNA G18 (ribose-2'-O)-methylase SpoU